MKTLPKNEKHCYVDKQNVSPSDDLTYIYKNLQEFRYSKPNENTIQILEYFMKHIKSNNFPINSQDNIEVLTILKDIIHNCFEDNIQSVDVLKITREIIELFINGNNCTINNLNLECDKINIDCTTNKSINKTTEKYTLDENYKILERIIDYYKKKWAKENKEGHLKIRSKSKNANKKIIKEIRKFEEYLLKVVLNRWSIFQKKIEKIEQTKDVQELLKNLFDYLNNIPELPNVTEMNSNQKCSTSSKITIECFKENYDFENEMNTLLRIQSVNDCVVEGETMKDVDKKNDKNDGTDNDILNEDEEDIEKLTNDMESEKIVSIANNQECYLNFSKIWNDHSRWMSMKHLLIRKGIQKYHDLYVSYPIYRKDFVISKSGNFGNVELGFTKNFHAIAIKRLTDHGICVDRCLNIYKILQNLNTLSNTYLVKTYAFQDLCGHTCLYTKLCDYNLMDYIKHLQSQNKFNAMEMKRISIDIVKGLAALHLYKPEICHGNLKLTNILIDNDGIIKLTEFGISKFLYGKQEKINDINKIWWPNEIHTWYKYIHSYKCTVMSDIHTCAMIIHIVNSGGMHPYGDNTKDIIHNIESYRVRLKLNSLDIIDILNQMLHTDPLKRPTISEIYNHIYFWSNEKRWQFIVACVTLMDDGVDESQSNETIEKRRISETFCKIMKTILLKENITIFWKKLRLKTNANNIIEIVPENNDDVQLQSLDDWLTSVYDLLIYLFELKINSPKIFNQSNLILNTYPNLPVIIYKCIKESNLLQYEEFKIFTPFFLGTDFVY